MSEKQIQPGTPLPKETICENCSRVISVDEVQMCEVCGRDGLGNCCIGTLDHQCTEDNTTEATQP